MKRSFIVTVNMPPDVSISEMRDYILSAVQCEKGSLHPDDSIFNMERSDFKAQHITKLRTEKLANKMNGRFQDVAVRDEPISVHYANRG